MPFDVLGCTRATLTQTERAWAGRSGESWESASCWGWTVAIVGPERGIPSRRGSSARADYVPALCTHRPSLLPIGWLGEVRGGGGWGLWALLPPKRNKPGDLEEVKVVTRFP